MKVAKSALILISKFNQGILWHLLLVFSLFLLLVSPAHALRNVCPLPQIKVTGLWSDPIAWDWASGNDWIDKRKGWNGISTQLGLIKTEGTWILDTLTSLECRGRLCNSCPSEIVLEIGYSPGRMLLNRKLIGRECHIRHVVAHEMRHASVFAHAESWGVKQARKSLRKTYNSIKPFPASSISDNSASKYWFNHAEKIVVPIYQAMDEYTDGQNNYLDSQQNYDAEQVVAEAECGLMPR